jgi:hypothetical protein
VKINITRTYSGSPDASGRSMPQKKLLFKGLFLFKIQDSKFYCKGMK